MLGRGAAMCGAAGREGAAICGAGRAVIAGAEGRTMAGGAEWAIGGAAGRAIGGAAGRAIAAGGAAGRAAGAAAAAGAPAPGLPCCANASTLSAIEEIPTRKIAAKPLPRVNMTALPRYTAARGTQRASARFVRVDTVARIDF